MNLEDEIISNADYMFQLIKDLKFVETKEDFEIKQEETINALNDYLNIINKKFI